MVKLDPGAKREREAQLLFCGTELMKVHQLSPEGLKELQQELWRVATHCDWADFPAEAHSAGQPILIR